MSIIKLVLCILNIGLIDSHSHVATLIMMLMSSICLRTRYNWILLQLLWMLLLIWLQLLSFIDDLLRVKHKLLFIRGQRPHISQFFKGLKRGFTQLLGLLLLMMIHLLLLLLLLLLKLELLRWYLLLMLLLLLLISIII